MQRGAIFGVVWSPVETGGIIVEVERQQQDKRMMTKGPGWVQNRGQDNGAGGQATASRPKLRVERRPFLAPDVVIFGVDFTGPYILVVKSASCCSTWIEIYSRSMTSVRV
ncbi:hypothetical protein PITC_047440 [Penicillium italicum]|uniref:Uncharacterized protein n=1 Tax=Penicillium italicum TaxID=40296 RepID=A0A0A2L7B6_PENIT|nr:hypothetical protein PITC_047440 [Penicillium italicum]